MRAILSMIEIRSLSLCLAGARQLRSCDRCQEVLPHSGFGAAVRSLRANFVARTTALAWQWMPAVAHHDERLETVQPCAWYDGLCA